MYRILITLGLFLYSQIGMAVDIALPVGSAPLGLSNALPLEAGGIAAIAAVSLVLGAKIIKRST